MISDQELLAQKIVDGKVIVLKLWARVETQAVEQLLGCVLLERS